MIDWLRRRPEELSIDLAGESLPVVLRRHKTARRMTMRLAPDGSEIRITLPQWGRTAEALDFARARAGWLAQQRAKLPPQAAPVEPGSEIRFRGQPLAVDWREAAPRRARRCEGALEIGGPLAGLPGRIQRWLEAEALALMATDLAHYCLRAGQAQPQMRLSRAKRRWGSCAHDQTIRLNWRLVQAPDLVRRSVVAHEVAHLVHFDHSPAFHALLGEVFDDDLAAANRWLKHEGRSLYAQFG